MSTYPDYYNTGSNLAKLEFEKQAFIGALAKGIWNSAPRKALGYLTGMGGRVGQKGSFAYKYLPSSTIGAGLGGGIFGAATAEEGNKMNAFAAGSLSGLTIGFIGNKAGFIGSRIANPFMRRGNVSRYSTLGFNDDAARALSNKNELNYIDHILSESGGNVAKLKNYRGTSQYKDLAKEYRDLVDEGISTSENNYVSDSFTAGLNKAREQAKDTAKTQFSQSEASARAKYYASKTLKTVGSVGGGFALVGAVHQPVLNVSESVSNKFVPKRAQAPSNIYNPYYGGF